MSALDQLRTARLVLCNSYAFAYFFFDGAMFAEDFSEEQNNINQNLFEDNQEMLAAEVRGRGRGLLPEASSGHRAICYENSTSTHFLSVMNFGHDLFRRVSTMGKVGLGMTVCFCQKRVCGCG